MFVRGEGRRRSSGSGSVASGIHHPPRFAIQFRCCQNVEYILIAIHLIVEGYIQLNLTLAGYYSSSTVVDRRPARRELYQSQLTCGTTLRDGLNACRRSAWKRPRVLADEHMSRRICGATLRDGLDACRRGAWNRPRVHGISTWIEKFLNRSRVGAKLRHGSSSVGQPKRDRRRTSDRFHGTE